MDYSSLERFFESGKLYPMMPDSTGTPDFSGSSEPVDLWENSKAVIADLKRMLQINPHFRILGNNLKGELLTVEVAESHYFRSSILNGK